MDIDAAAAAENPNSGDLQTLRRPARAPTFTDNFHKENEAKVRDSTPASGARKRVSKPLNVTEKSANAIRDALKLNYMRKRSDEQTIKFLYGSTEGMKPRYPICKAMRVRFAYGI